MLFPVIDFLLLAPEKGCVTCMAAGLREPVRFPPQWAQDGGV